MILENKVFLHSVLLRVLQRNRTNMTYILRSPRMCRLKAGDSGQPMANFHLCLEAREPGRSGCKFQPKGYQAENSEREMFQFEFKGRKKLISHLEGRQAGGISPIQGKVTILLSSDLQLIERESGRTSCFTQSIDLNVQLVQKHLYRNTPKNIWAPCGPVKLTLNINYQTQNFLDCIYFSCLGLMTLFRFQNASNPKPENEEMSSNTRQSLCH